MVYLDSFRYESQQIHTHIDTAFFGDYWLNPRNLEGVKASNILGQVAAQEKSKR